MIRVAALALFALLGAVRPALAEKAAFVLVVGVNRSVDADTPPLHFADDDAAQYLSLFRSLGARTYSLATFDENTSRLHPQAVAEARAPRRIELERAVAALAADVALARARHIETAFYFVYAGHGNVRGGEGYLALEDMRIDAATLEREVIDRVGADQTHLIVDACYSYFLVFGRGPGGARRPFAGFSRLSSLAQRPEIGLLLSTSSARESHEWEAFSAGVFSHEVRSGLYGGADSDGDGRVSYREIAAFVDRANAAIPNDRFRPDVFARAPSRSSELIDLRPHLQRRIELDGAKEGHILIEDARGVRLADVHSAGPVRLVRPSAPGNLYLRRVAEEVEYVLPASEEVVELAALSPLAPRAHARGAAHEAFETIFSLPFDRSIEAAYVFRKPPDPAEEVRAAQLHRRRAAGYGLLGAGGATLLTAAGLSIAGVPLRHLDAGASQLDVIARNEIIHRTEISAAVLYGVGAATVLSGALLAFLPARAPRLHVALGPGALSIGYEVHF